MKRFVVDASVAMKWFIPEIHSLAAARLLEEQLFLCAPELLVPQLGNTLWKKMRRQEVSRSEAAEIVRAMEIMPLEIFPSLPLLDGAFEIATSLQNCPLVTADSRLHAAARSSPLAPHVAWVEDEL